MNQQKTRKFILLIVLFMLSFGFSAHSLAQKYSDLQTKTTQSAVKRKHAIYPSKYADSADLANTDEKEKKKETFGDLIMKMVRSLILIVALFLGVAAYIAKNKDKFKNIKLPNALKNVELPKKEPNAAVASVEEKAPEVETPAQTTSLDPREAKVKELVFKFFEINK